MDSIFFYLAQIGKSIVFMNEMIDEYSDVTALNLYRFINPEYCEGPVQLTLK